METIKDIIQLYPVIDGHFWLEYEGIIIDPYFKEYDFIKFLQNCQGDMVYLPADPIIQQVMLKKFNSIFDIEKLGETLIERDYKEKYGCCFFNTILNKTTFKEFKIVFGSMGWKRKDKEEIHWEFGGENYKIKNFIKS
jgi:hypothetical protein